MRRGIGVAHIQQQRQTQQQMADLGAQITAERVGQIADQLEALERQLKSLAAKHKDEIKRDPVVRARFRQLADSLGVDLVSSKKNVFAAALGLGDFYYQLAVKVVEACMKERKFCGSYVPLRRVLAVVERTYDSATMSDKDRVTISEADVRTSLSKLDCLGAGYKVVSLGGVAYIQTTPDGAKGSDELPLLNMALAVQKKQLEAAKRELSAKRLKPSATSSSRVSTTSPSSVGASRTASNTVAHRGGIGAAYVLGAHPLASEADTLSGEDDIPLTAQCVALTERQIGEEMMWQPHRTHAALQRLVQDGSVWVDYPDRDPLRRKAAASASKGGKSTPQPVKAIRAVEEKEVWRTTKRETKDLDDGAVYWFVSLTTL